MNKKRRHFLAELLDDPRWSSISVPLLSILLSILAASILLLLLGKNPIVAYTSLLKGCGILKKPSYGGGKGMLSDFFIYLNVLAPMIIASLAFVVGSRAGLFNIGISGQMLVGGYFAFILVGYSDLPAYLAKPLVILIGLATGALMGAFIGFLKYKFNINEVVSTILVNYIINYLVGFSVNGWHVDTITRAAKVCSPASRLSFVNVDIGGVKCNIPIGILLAVLAVLAVNYVFKHTVFGFELKAVGLNNTCARYTGIKVGSRIVGSMAISGMLAGLAGVCYYAGYLNTIFPKTLSSMGYDSIAVAILGNSSPIGCLFASILITIFQNGTNYMSSTLGVAKEIANLMTGILLLFSACGGYVREIAHKIVQHDRDRERLEAQKKAEAEAAPAGKEA